MAVPLFHTSLLRLQVLSLLVDMGDMWIRFWLGVGITFALIIYMRWDVTVIFSTVSIEYQTENDDDDIGIGRTHREWKSKTGERKEKRATQHCQLTSPLIFVFIRNVIMLLPYSGPFCPVCFQFRSFSLSFSCFSLFTQNGFAFFSRWNSLAQQIGRQCLQKYI